MKYRFPVAFIKVERIRNNISFFDNFGKLRVSSRFFYPDIVSLSVLAIFIGAAVKGGLSDEYETIFYTGWISFFREISGFIGVAGLIVFAAHWRGDHIIEKPSISSPFFWLLIFKLMLLIRFIFDGSIAIKYGASLIGSIIIWIVISSRSHMRNWDEFYVSIIKGIIYFSFLMVTINCYLYFYAWESTSWKGRFVGIFHHPNFLGVNIAILFAIFLMFSVSINIKKLESIKVLLVFIGVIAAFFLVVVSGSRTGMLGVLVALFTYSIVKKLLSIRAVLFIFFGILCLYLISQIYIKYLFNIFPGLERILSNQNTRGEVWSIMIDDFLSNPLLGAGKSAGATAGSYLRATAIGGVFMGFALLLTVFHLSRRSIKIFSSVAPAWVIPISVVVICAVTEGVLVDSLSFGSVIFSFMAVLLSLNKIKIRRPFYVDSL